MDESEVATKAPESDAMERSPSPQAPEAVPPPNHTMLSEHCTSDRPTPSGSAASGELAKINDIDVYLSKPGDYPHVPSKLLLFLTSGTGIHSVNNQLQADKFASEGFLVVMPDMFANDPAPNPSNIVDDTSQTLIDQIKLRAAETAKSFMIDMWLARHTPEKVLPILHKVLEGAKEEFADAIACGGGIYSVGYCTGAKYIIQLAGENPDTTSQKIPDEESGFIKTGPLIKCGAAAHGTLVTKEDFNGVKAPLMLVCVQDDQLFPEDVRIAGEEYMKKNGVEHKIEIYPGVPHGFAVVGEYESQEIKAAQEQAFGQMLTWLKDH